MLFCFSLLVRNLITHSLCVFCVWIMWWSRTLCSWEHMTRWIVLRNLMLKTLWHNVLIRCDIGTWTFILNACCFEPKVFLTNFICNSELKVNLLPTWTLLRSLNKISFYVIPYFHVFYYINMYIGVENVTFSGIRAGQTFRPMCYVLTIF